MKRCYTAGAMNWVAVEVRCAGCPWQKTTRNLTTAQVNDMAGRNALMQRILNRHTSRCRRAKQLGRQGLAVGQTIYGGIPEWVRMRKEPTMAKRTTSGKVYRVVVKRDAGPAGGWGWTPTDAQGRVKLAGGRAGYSRKSDAARGARRACGAKVRIAYE